MPLMKMSCPSCGVEGTVSILDEDYEGYYACWKCRELFSIVVQKGELVSWEAASREEVEKWMEAKDLKDKFRR